MYYSLVALLALIVLLVSNYDILFKKKNIQALTAYRFFLWAIILYYITDMLWGVFDYLKLRTVLFLDTEIYFLAMALGIAGLTKYTVIYVEDKTIFGKIFFTTGIVFFLFVSIMMLINIFNPVFFYIGSDGSYKTSVFRYLTLGIQIILLFLTSIFAFYKTFKTRSLVGKRYFTIALFGLIMLTAISVQMYFPLLPFYSIGYMVGCSILHKFIVENEKEEYRLNLEIALEREKQQSRELKTAWELAYTDALTGAGSKLAYLEKVEKIDEIINDKKQKEFSIAVFDINNLKKVNDSLGHQVGDKYIIDAFELIKNTFKNSVICRIGGDEFVGFLDEDYQDRKELINIFNNQVEENIKNNKVVISIGVADYNKDTDKTCRYIVERADFLMYERKKYLKELLK